MVPDGHADLIFFDSGEVRVAGMHDRVDEPLLTAGTVARGVRLRPEAVASAFRIEAHHLRNRSVDVRDLDDLSLQALHWNNTEIDAWVGTFRVDAAVSAAAVLLHSGAAVGAAGREAGLSERQLERRFNSVVGIGPKAFQRISPFQQFLASQGNGASLAERAQRAGYADQSHLTREVRRLAGTTPSQLDR